MKKSSTGKNYFILTLCILLIAIITATGYIKFSKKPNTSPKDAIKVTVNDSKSNIETTVSIDNTSQNDNPNENDDSKKTDEDDWSGFSEEEIETAKKVAEEYYKNTTFVVKSITYDLKNFIYKEYIKEYSKENLITFTVYVTEFEDIPRGMALGRKNSESNWSVLYEGF